MSNSGNAEPGAVNGGVDAKVLTVLIKSDQRYVTTIVCTLLNSY